LRKAEKNGIALGKVADKGLLGYGNVLAHHEVAAGGCHPAQGGFGEAVHDCALHRGELFHGFRAELQRHRFVAHELALGGLMLKLSGLWLFQLFGLGEHLPTWLLRRFGVLCAALPGPPAAPKLKR